MEIITARYIATPPINGIGFECTLLSSLGMSIAPIFGAIFINYWSSGK